MSHQYNFLDRSIDFENEYASLGQSVDFEYEYAGLEKQYVNEMEIQMKKNRIFTKRRLLILMGALIFSVAIVSAVTMIATHTCLIYECPISWVRLSHRFITAGFQVVHDFFQSLNKSHSHARPESVATWRPTRSDFDLDPIDDRHGLLSLEISFSNYFLSQLYRIVPQTKNAQTVENVKSQMMKVFVNVQKITLVPSVS